VAAIDIPQGCPGPADVALFFAEMLTRLPKVDQDRLTPPRKVALNIIDLDHQSGGGRGAGPNCAFRGGSMPLVPHVLRPRAPRVGLRLLVASAFEPTPVNVLNQRSLPVSAGAATLFCGHSCHSRRQAW
jgi:hypothetical protein